MTFSKRNFRNYVSNLYFTVVMKNFIDSIHKIIEIKQYLVVVCFGLITYQLDRGVVSIPMIKVPKIKKKNRKFTAHTAHTIYQSEEKNVRTEIKLNYYKHTDSTKQ